MRGYIGYYFDGLLSQLLVTLHPLVLFIAMWLISENAGYDWVRGGGGGCNRVYCIHVPGLDPLIFSFRSFFLFDWVGVLWPQLSKVLKPVRWPAASLISLMVSVDVKHHDYLLAASLSLQCPCRGRLFVCCCGRCSCVHLRGEPTLFPGWLVYKYKLCYSNLWLVTLHVHVARNSDLVEFL